MNDREQVDKNSMMATRERTLQRFGLGCGIAVTTLLIGSVIALLVLAPQWLVRLAQQDAVVPSAIETDVEADGVNDGDPLGASGSRYEQVAAHREAELTHLNSYGWVNEDDGVVHIPIERAIALVVEEGLPVGLQAGGADSADGADAASLEGVDLENVSFAEDVLPIFEDRCSECHDWPDPREDLILTSYSDVMYGSSNGDVVIPGEPENSLLVEMIETGEMPRRRDPLTATQIALIKAWIEAGAADN